LPAAPGLERADAPAQRYVVIKSDNAISCIKMRIKVIEAASGGARRFFIAKGSGSRFEANQWNSALPAAMLPLRRAGGH
jgi:hypothetical protein